MQSATRTCGRALLDQLFDEEVGLLQEVPATDEAAELLREMLVSDELTTSRK